MIIIVMVKQKTDDGQIIDRRAYLAALSATGATFAGCIGEDPEEEPDPDGDTNVDSGDDTDGTGDEADDEPVEGDPIVIGGLIPHSGPFADYGAAYVDALEFALEEVNQEGGALGRELTLEWVDTGSDASEAVTAFTRFVEQDDAVAMTGPMSSDVGIRAADTGEDMEVPLFLFASASHATLSKDSRYTYRVGSLPAPPTIRAQSQIVEEQGYENIGVIIEDYAFGRSVEASIDRFFPEDVQLQIEVAPFGEDDFTPYLRNLDEDIEMLVGTGAAAGIHNLYNQMLELELRPEMVTGPLAFPETSYDSIGEDIVEAGFTFFHLVDPYTTEFAEVASRYFDESGDRFTVTHAVGYVTGKLIAAGLEDAGEADPVALSDAIRNIEFDTLFARPIEYTEWGELDHPVEVYSQFELEAPDYYPEGEWRLTEAFRSDPLPPYDPEEFPLD